MYDNVEKLREIVREKNRKKYEEESLRRLSSIIAKKLQTTFIGAISAIEEGLGYIWGHNKPSGQLDETQRMLAEIWAKVRTDILNNGNNQLRAIKHELDTYTVFWNRYKIEIKPRKINEEDLNV